MRTTNEKEMTMSILLITYNQPKMNPSDGSVVGFMSEYKHVQISENSYAIETNEQTRTVFNKIIPYLDSNAHLFIVTVMQPFTVQGLDHVRDWLRKHLPEE